MKKALFLLLGLWTYVSNAQTSVQAAIVKSGANKVTVYCVPNSNINNVILSNITIVISIPKQATNPTITVTNKYGFTGMAWVSADNNSNAEVAGHSAPYVDPAPGGRAYYTFYGNDLTNSYTTPTDWPANSKKPVADFTFSSLTGITDAEIHIDDLSNGSWGSGSPTGVDSYWYITQTGLGDVTNTTQMFLGAGAVNTGGNSFSFSPAQALAFLPAFFQEFNVNKSGNYDAALSWSTAQEQNVSHFIIERSANGTSWGKAGEVKAKGNSSTPTKYSFTDVKVYDGVAASKTVFYRIKAVDLDGQEKLFPVRSLKFSATGSKEISIYPNPAKDGFTLSIPLISNTGKIRLNLMNRLGQVIHSREINGATAANYYYDIKTPGVIAGEYMLQIIRDGELLDTKKVIVQR